MLTSRHTVLCSYIGYLTQAITINFAPLLFVTFEKTYDISLSKVSLLIAISFTTQFLTDFIAAQLSDRLNLRYAAITAHVLAVIGLTAFAYLPDILPNHYLGLCISVIIASAGGGLTEVVISPIVEACPTKKKSASMALLHSFYSWGLVGVVLLSTAFFEVFGLENWRILAILWAIVPFIGAIGFCLVPVYDLQKNNDSEGGNTSMYKIWLFWLFVAIMMCTGAAEQAMSQWASVFAEKGLGISKTLGDLLGSMGFAILMGSARVFYGLFSRKIRLRTFMTLSCILCIVSYLVVILSPFPFLSLVGCSLCGLSVGILWPGTLSLAARNLPNRNVKLFALLAFAGDIGCLIGPACAGWIAGLFGDNLKVGFIFTLLFPIVMLILMKFIRKQKTRGENYGT